MLELDLDKDTLTLQASLAADLTISPEVVPPEILQQALDAGSLAIHFASPSDGRGYSLARQLRDRGFKGKLAATGHLIPDQARQAKQSGFDAVWLVPALVDRHSETAWRQALTSAVPNIYHKAQAGSIWNHRHAGSQQA